MFDEIYKDKETIKRHYDAPLVDERIRYLKHLSKQGYTSGTLRIKERYLLGIINFANLSKPKKITVEEIKKTADRWAQDCLKNAKKKQFILKDLSLF